MLRLVGLATRSLPKILLALALIVPSLAFAERTGVLAQIDVPHSYYFREMYLPQLTNGPSSACWSPDSTELVYSMRGRLWRQKLGEDVAEELTEGSSYDYQPDWSRDGKSIVYASYAKDAVELRIFDLAAKTSRPLTSGGAVNVEPRWSPDGARVAYVSTAFNKRFHVFVTTPDGKSERWTGENKSPLPRYYYSAFDHELSPAWAPDGKKLTVVSNKGRIYGTGGFFEMSAAANAPLAPIHDEETTWRARPDYSPDGKRLVYSSYLGGQWHHLWIIPAGGGHPIPLTYGDHDDTQPRWSPDGSKIAFISNRTGETSLWVLEVAGGKQTRVEAKTLKYRRGMGSLILNLPAAARVSITGADDRTYAPSGAWIHADDAFDRAERPFEAHYFHAPKGTVETTVPAGKVRVEVMRGFEHVVEKFEVDVAENARVTKKVVFTPFKIGIEPWVSGDLHVHMNYGGTYRNTPKHLVEQAAAENLGVVENLIVNKEQRIPDIAYFSPDRDPASTADVAVMHSQEFHTSYWGHLGLLGLSDHYLIPDYVAYPGSAVASAWPTNAIISDLAHAQGALVGYVHPYDWLPNPEKEEKLTHALPIDVALGKVDYLELVAFSDHEATATVWYRLLDLGFRIPAGAGTDAMANFASLRGPVGMNRVYAKVPRAKPVDAPAFRAALKRGETFATNGPLLRFELGKQRIGGEVALDGKPVAFRAAVRSIVPLESAAIVCNGKVARELELDPQTKSSADAKGDLSLDASGWCVLRASSKKAEHPVLDLYPYATTSPIYVVKPGVKPWSEESAAYFRAWIARTRASAEKAEWNTPKEKVDALEQLDRAAKAYQQSGS